MPNLESDVPTIAVEFVSRSKRDRQRDYDEKRREYLGPGVSDYWIIDRLLRQLTVYRRPPAEQAEQMIEAKGTYRTALLPGFELSLARLHALSDAWKRPL